MNSIIEEPFEDARALLCNIYGEGKGWFELLGNIAGEGRESYSSMTRDIVRPISCLESYLHHATFQRRRLLRPAER